MARSGALRRRTGRSPLLDERGDALLDRGGELRAGRQAGLGDVLELDADVLGLRADQVRLRAGVPHQGADLALEAGATLTQLALDARAGALDLALQRLARLLAATLELVELRLELALGLRPRAVLRAQLVERVDDVVAGGQRGADVGQRGALGDRLHGVLGLTRLTRGGGGAGLRGRAGAAACGGAAALGTSLSGLLGRGAALGGSGAAARARLAGVGGALRLGGAGCLGHQGCPPIEVLA